MPQGELPISTSNPPGKSGRQTHSRSVVPGNVSASAVVVDTSAHPAVMLKSLPMQSKSSKKKKKTKGDNVAMLSSPASATTSMGTALLPSAPKFLPAEKKKELVIHLAKALKAASPLPVVVAPKEAGTALAPTVSTALDTLPERNASSDVDNSTSGSGNGENSSNSNSSSLGSSSDDDSLSSSSQPAMVTGASIISSGTAIVTAAEVIAAMSAATSTAALSSTNPSIEVVTEEESKEPGWIPENDLQPMEEEQVEVYSPGTPSGESSNQSSVEGEEE